jgi:hypothetical protein
MIARVALCFAAAAIGVVLLGRWEHARASAHQRALMAHTYHLATARGLRSPLISAYRLSPTFDCLLYRAPGDRPFAYELCFDSEGRLIETIDRSGSQVRIGSLRQEPSQAGIRIEPRRLLQAFVQAGIAKDPRLEGVLLTGDRLPTGYDDSGPLHD